MAETLKNALLQALTELQSLPLDTLLERRHRRLLDYGTYKEA
jgi:acetyl-CoA carboxylase alpha subunit